MSEQTYQVVDPHIHLFDLSKGEYAWLGQLEQTKRRLIYRDFGFSDIRLREPFTLTKCVHIEAGFNNQHPQKEIAHWENAHHVYLSTVQNNENSFAEQTPLQFASIANADLFQAPDTFEYHSNSALKMGSCKGFRHIIDGQIVALWENENARINLRHLNKLACIFELQVSVTTHQALDTLLEVITQHPHLHFVLNHAGFMPFSSISGQAFKWWCQVIESLSQSQQSRQSQQSKNLSIKLSGFEMHKKEYETDELLPALDRIFSSFGQAQIMMASNFPLCLYRLSYQDYWQQAFNLCQQLQVNKRALLGENAARIYF
uniref:amidohydrolase family protein n=1 Tax=Ningiella ruwaisensis TaxID=2364274 RepID=UPI0010A053BD|nr:amidohydrolase family protein [Ningiella ruwaisensis]